MKITFISFKSLLDRNSGAALELKAILEQMAKRGAEVSSLSFNCYDNGDDYVADEEIDARLSPRNSSGKIFHYDSHGIRHYLYVGSSKDTQKLKVEELTQFIELAAREIRNQKPDYLIYFGSNEIIPILKAGKSSGAKIVFYVGTAGYPAKERPVFAFADQRIAPSQYIGALCQERFQKPFVHIPTAVNFPIETPDTQTLKARRRFGALTLINPSPDKGGHFFFKIARNFENNGRLFMCVESRSTREFWRKSGVNVDKYHNVVWAPWQADIRPMLRQTALLLMPSLIDEAAGKVIAEAMTLAVPSVGFDIGGIKEQIGRGGVVLPFDHSLSASPETGLYTSECSNESVMRWTTVINQLLGDDEIYEKLCHKACLEAQRFQIEKVVSEWSDKVFAGC